MRETLRTLAAIALEGCAGCVNPLEAEVANLESEVLGYRKLVHKMSGNSIEILDKERGIRKSDGSYFSTLFFSLDGGSKEVMIFDYNQNHRLDDEDVVRTFYPETNPADGFQKREITDTPASKLNKLDRAFYNSVLRHRAAIQRNYNARKR